MRRKLLALVTAIALLSLTISPALAQSLRIRGVGFALGSLIATGEVELVHTHPEDVRVVLRATGLAEVSCHQGGHDYSVGMVPVEATGRTLVEASAFDPHGIAFFHVETGRPKPVEHACASGWRTRVGFVFWDQATLTGKALDTGLFTRNDYVCVTTFHSVTCDQVH